jgi:hypothetical protein
MHSATVTMDRSPRGDSRAAARGGRTAALAVLACIAAASPSTTARAGECQAQDERSCPKALSAETARGLGLATGARASSVSTSALAYSPAALALGNLYHVEGNVDYSSFPNTVAIGGAVVDSSTSALGAGVGLRGFLSGDEGYDGIDGRVGLGVSLSDAFALGLAGRYLRVDLDRSDGSESIVVEEVRACTMDASLRIVPIPGLQLDIAALNFIDADSPLVPLTVAGGIAFAVASSFSLGADVLADMTTFDSGRITLGGGFEYLAGSSVPLRLGYGFDTARKIHFLGAGIGYTDQRIGLDLGVHQELTRPGPEEIETRIMGAIRYYVN